MLAAYVDTGNDYDSQQYRSVAVVGCVARHTVWKPLEDAWQAVVVEEWSKRRMDSVEDSPYFHVTDVWTFSNPFSRRNGWNEDSRRRLFSACTDVSADAVAGSMKVVACLCPLEDYKRVCEAVPDTPHLVDICGNWCMAHSAASDPEEFTKEGISLFFDPSDPIAGSINQKWKHKNTRSQWPWSLVRQKRFDFLPE